MDDLMNLSIGQLFGGAAGILVLLSVFIEITPFKFNPVSAFLNWIGARTNKNIMDKFDSMEDEVSGLKKEIDTIRASEDERDAETRRVRILEFADEVAHAQGHSKERYTQVLHDIDVYDSYCDAHKGFKNSQTVGARKLILKAYDKHLAENDFL
jgi:hypothetical protein